jgi:triosephosphate isomerase (TIM)
MNTEPGSTLESLVRDVVALPELDRALKAGITVVLAPPFLSLQTTVSISGNSGLKMAAQNCHHESSGAYTGEVSAPAIKAAGADWVIVGHSERRRDAFENDGLIGRKAAAAVAAGLTPIICIGESLEERSAGITHHVIAGQLLGMLATAGRDVVQASIIAYEPVWAIGTGLAATPVQAQDVHSGIRSVLASAGVSTPILYGGSVTPANAQDLFSCKDIDGALVGGASLKADSFAGILDAACTAWG